MLMLLLLFTVVVSVLDLLVGFSGSRDDCVVWCDKVM